MTTAILTLLILLQVKHWYVDFVNQSEEEIKSKGIYGDGQGVMHSLKHGIGTIMALLAVTGYPYFIYALVLGFIDFVVHYHIDWVKVNYGNNDIKTKQFWNHIGIDQMAHQITYIFIAYMIT